MTVFSSLSDNEIITLLRQGSVGILPTDTIYGLVACASDQEAVARLYKIKHREGKPGTLIAASVDQLEELGLQREHLQAVEYLWPNPVSIVLPVDDLLAYLHQGKDSLAVRIPKDETVKQILEQTGPLLTSSANYPGDPAANNIEEAQAYFGDEVDFYADGGDVSGRAPSTVARLNPDGSLELLRQGAVKLHKDKE